MAVVVFSDDPVLEARALIAFLTLWMRELPDLPDQPARPASGKFTYRPDGGVSRLIIELAAPEAD